MARGSFAAPESVFSVDPNPDPRGLCLPKRISYEISCFEGIDFFFGGWWKFAWSMEVLEEFSVPDPDVLSLPDPDPK